MESRRFAIEDCISVIPSIDAGADVFMNENRPWDPPSEARGIFGGFLLGQSVTAAQKTLPSADYSVHSLQSTFLRQGTTKFKLLHHVDRVADGRTFATRLVRTMQNDSCVFMAIIGFQKGIIGGDSANIFRHDLQMPSMDGKSPNEIQSGYEGIKHHMGVPQDLVDALPSQFDWRFLPYEPTSDPARFELRAFVRAPKLSSNDNGVHLSALAYFTDIWLLSVPHLASHIKYDKMKRKPGIQITLNHSIVFHHPDAKVDEWMVCLRSTEWSGGGRVVITQRLWEAKSGILLLSNSQEALMRYARQDAKI